MNRLTERDEYGNADIIALSDIMPDLYDGLSFSETNALTAALNRLAAYEDTGLTPEEVNAMKAEYSDTFQAHLNQLCDLKDKRISELKSKNAREHRLFAIMDINSAAALMLRGAFKGDTTETETES